MTFKQCGPSGSFSSVCRVPLALLAGVAIAVTNPAAAQQAPAFSPTDSLSRRPTDERYPGENYRKFDLQRTADLSGAGLYQHAVDFARCVGRKHADKLAGLLGAAAASNAEQTAAQDMAKAARGCSDTRLQVSMRLLRGATAEALLGTMNVPLGLTDADFTAFHAAMPAAAPADANVQKIVECQVSTAPGLVRKLVGTTPGTPESDTVGKKLVAATGSCGSVATSDLDTALIYRSYLAEGLYHLLSAAAGGSKS